MPPLQLRVGKDSKFCCGFFAGKCIGYVCPCDCGCCLWQPACISYAGPFSFISMFMCNCRDSANPGAYKITDNKGNFTALVPAGEDGTVACFSENIYWKPEGDEMKVSMFWEK